VRGQKRAPLQAGLSADASRRFARADGSFRDAIAHRRLEPMCASMMLISGKPEIRCGEPGTDDRGAKGVWIPGSRAAHAPRNDSIETCEQ
jgi:hypothetical protein